MNHADLAADLPFYANGTLDAERTAAIETELETCERCALELHAIETLRVALLDAERAPLASHDADGCLRDVFARIDAETPGGRTPAAPVPRMPRVPRRALQVGGGLAAALAIAIGTAGVMRPHDAAPGVAGVRSDARRSAASAADDAVAPAPIVAPEPELARSAAAPPAAAGLAPPAPPKLAAVARRRMLARDGSISLIVGDVGAAIERVQRLALEESGVVTHLDDDAPAVFGARHTATLTIGVPEPRFDAAMAAIAGYGTTVTRAVRTEDLTGAIVDAAARLRNLRREEADLLKIMDRSGKISDVLDVEQRLAGTRQQIEQLDGEAKTMRDRVADATIAVSFSDARTVTPVRPGVGVQLSNRWNSAVADVRDFSVRQLGRAFELFVFSPYLIVVGAVAYALYRRLRRPRAVPPSA